MSTDRVAHPLVKTSLVAHTSLYEEHSPYHWSVPDLSGGDFT